MGVFEKFLRAGEGKRVRQLAELVAPINELEPKIDALSDAELQAKTVRVPASASRRARRSTTS